MHSFRILYIDGGCESKILVPILGTFWSQKIKVTTKFSQQFVSDTITWVFSSYSFHISSIDAGCQEINTYIYFAISKSRSQLDLCQHFGSDMITGGVFSAELSYFIHRCKMVRERYLYILRSNVSLLNFVKTGHDDMSSFQHTAFIFRT